MNRWSFWQRRRLAQALVAMLTTFLFLTSLFGLSANIANAAAMITPTPTPAPSITLTSITQPGGPCLTVKGPIVLTATVTGFTPTGVTFLRDNTTLIGNVQTAPYTFTWTTNIPEGTHTVTAFTLLGQERLTSTMSVTIFYGCTATPPPTTPTTTVTPPPITPTIITTATPPTSSCKINYMITSQWPGGFGATIAITNTGTTPLNGWTLRFAFPNGQAISQGWNGQFSQNGANVTVTNLSYNATIAPGASLASSPGFNGTWNGMNQAPGSFTLNGVTCQ